MLRFVTFLLQRHFHVTQHKGVRCARPHRSNNATKVKHIIRTEVLFPLEAVKIAWLRYGKDDGSNQKEPIFRTDCEYRWKK
jgi:hypothetical protein